MGQLQENDQHRITRHLGIYPVDDGTRYQKSYVQSALKMLGIEKLVIAIHDQSFPSLPDEETGRGTPYSYGADSFLQMIAALGFNGMQLGPQGKTSLGNPSPYDSTLFSKNELSISLARLQKEPRWCGLLAKGETSHHEGSNGDRNYQSYRSAWSLQYRALNTVLAHFEKRKSDRCKAVAVELENWRQDNDWWLSRDEQYEENVPLFQLAQFLAHAQHSDFRRRANELKLQLFGDLQIGFSNQDKETFKDLFLPGYLLGAPPSRTNPDGQPWGYPVFNPRLYFSAEDDEPGPVLHWMMRRIEKFLVDYDGIRIDHPHGLVCPWVYDSTAEDALKAVQNGARLFDSPDIAEHPLLAEFAIVSADQLNGSVPRYADGWVKALADEQIDHYAVLIDLVLDLVAGSGHDRSNLICEVLSSCPFPLQQVLRKHNLGRLRVTQKANPLDATDNYRSDTANPSDWIMVGTHDTEPLWLSISKWDQEKRKNWATYLASRLEPQVEERDAFAAQLVANESLLIEAMFADLFVGPAKNVSVFFADLFGLRGVYNAPGIINDTNWMLSVPPDFASFYQQKIDSHSCLYLPRVLAMALRAKLNKSTCAVNLAQRLDQTK